MRGKAAQQVKLVQSIAQRLAASVLPGETAFSRDELDESAAFIFSAAGQRAAERSALKLESATLASGKRVTRIAMANDNMPFLVDSMAATIAGHGLVIDRLVHPVVSVARDAKGQLTGLPEDGEHESWIYIETGRTDARTRRELTLALEVTLTDVRAAVTDWPAMQNAMEADAQHIADSNPEGAALLLWLNRDMLTQLGHMVRRRDGTVQSALGVCRIGARSLLAPGSFERAFEWFGACIENNSSCHVPLIIKSNLVSTVHRRVPFDLFLVPIVKDGRVAALSVHAGVWTSAALATPPHDVPVLRAQVARVMAKFGFDPKGHAGKALVHALTALPHDVLIGFDDAAVERVATAMMSVVDRPRPRLVLICAPLERHLFAFVWLPRESHNTTVRQQVQAMLTKACDGRVLDWSLQMEEGRLALLRFVIDVRSAAGSDCSYLEQEAKLNAELHALLRGWSEAVESELARDRTPGRAAAIAERFAGCFPSAYRTAFGPAEAATDINRLLHLSAIKEKGALRRDARLYHRAGDARRQLRLKLYQWGSPLALADAVPVLENFGLKALVEIPTLLNGGKSGAIHDFLLELPEGISAGSVLERRAEIETAIAHVLNGAAEGDAFNRLIIANGLAAREVNWLRAWFRYLRQAGMTFAIDTVVDAVQRAPDVTSALLQLFLARHDPEFAEDSAQAEGAAQEAIRDGLTKVSSINDDKLLRQYRALIEAILRTNAFAPSGQEALAFKFDSALVPGLPKPVPWREIFVYSRRVEGIHLRAGPIARGGLRWSDRRDDYRTEVLGLMKAQRVKNAVIVPTGAKGGFYPKQLPNPAIDREGWQKEGRASYQLFIRSLLSLTDNIVQDKVIHPAGIVIRDGEDPYFVVAADKGTASFSDTANAIAEEFDFWLDDAFASGGSKGYDHKEMGITARGAWISVQRHFLELGVDVQHEPIRVAGCGDMSGDVFGNGMLQSRTIKLVAAFDHRHIFLDPDPDPAKSWDERARMFALPRSSWDDYDKGLISQGGGVFPRSQKSIPLSPEAREILGLTAESTDPDTLIAAILKSPVDLLWFGGIGTYVKASGENNIQVGDPSNDAVRVDGNAVRAKVIGEGANLGCTQAGRIEFCLAGGRDNPDFIDNSAGVDCSDKEVNIKIALASAKRAKRLTEDDRVTLLGEMTDDVAALVLEDNRLQTLALSIAEAGGARTTPALLRVAETLENEGHLDRQTAGLADNRTLIRRASDGQGLTRPELAVLLSSAKLMLQDALESSTVPDDPGLEDDLLAAFPPPMQAKFRKDILSHRLRREIIATRLADRIVNRLGLMHPFEVADEESTSLAKMAGAFIAAERLFGMEVIWQAIDSAAMPESARILLFEHAAQAMRAHIADLLRAGSGTMAPSAVVADLQSGVDELSAAVDAMLVGEARARSQQTRAELRAAGAPARECAMVAKLVDLDGTAGLARLARDSGLSITRLTQAFTTLGAQLGMDWAQSTAAQLSPSDPWERLLSAGLARFLQQIRLDFLRRVTLEAPDGPKDDPLEAVSRWIAEHGPAVHRFRTIVNRAQATPPPTAAMLAQIAGQARGLLAQ